MKSYNWFLLASYVFSFKLQLLTLTLSDLYLFSFAIHENLGTFNSGRAGECSACV